MKLTTRKVYLAIKIKGRCGTWFIEQEGIITRLGIIKGSKFQYSNYTNLKIINENEKNLKIVSQKHRLLFLR